jgi:hypothetical protein
MIPPTSQSFIYLFEFFFLPGTLSLSLSLSLNFRVLTL